MFRRSSVTVAAIALAVTGLPGCGGAQEPATDQPRIAFISERREAAEIFTMNADGTDTRRLASVGYLSEYFPASPPAWAPDGEQIAFTKAEENGASIYLVDAGGEESATLLVRRAAFPAWSPDGDLIAFTRSRGETSVDTWVVRPDGTDPRILVRHAAFGAWSPDGEQLVFARLSDDDKTDLHVVSLNDGTVRRLTNGPGHDLLPAWAPADRIVFERYDDNAEIFVIDPDGTNEARLTDDPAEDTSPVWSPDGVHVAFTNDLTFTREWRKGEEIFVMAADGSERTRVTHNRVRDVAPSWQPTR